MVFFFVLIGLNTVSAKVSEPPKVFIDKGACPFECCTYRDWSARKDITLVDKPNGSKTVGTIKKDEVIKAVTGEVHVIPTPMEIVFKHRKFKVGDKAYLLTYEGEGFHRVWFNGKITSEEIFFPFGDSETSKSCPTPSDECWGRVTGQHKGTWWIQIKMKNGKLGWTKESDQFDNQDSCS